MDDESKLPDLAVDVMRSMDDQKQINETLKVAKKKLKSDTSKLIEAMHHFGKEEVTAPDGRTLKLNTEKKVTIK